MSDFNKVKINITGLENSILSNQKINFSEDTNKYIFIENNLVNDYYYFPKSLTVTPIINNIKGYTMTYSPKNITGTNDFNITFTENTLTTTNKIIATYWCGWGGNTSYNNAVGGQFKTPGLEIDEISDIYNTIVVAFIIPNDDNEGITPKLWLDEEIYSKEDS